MDPSVYVSTQGISTSTSFAACTTPHPGKIHNTASRTDSPSPHSMPRVGTGPSSWISKINYSLHSTCPLRSTASYVCRSDCQCLQRSSANKWIAFCQVFLAHSHVQMMSRCKGHLMSIMISICWKLSKERNKPV